MEQVRGGAKESVTVAGEQQLEYAKRAGASSQQGEGLQRAAACALSSGRTRYRRSRVEADQPTLASWPSTHAGGPSGGQEHMQHGSTQEQVGGQSSVMGA